MGARWASTPTADTSSIPTGHDTSNPIGLLAVTRTAPAIRPRVETPPSHRICTVEGSASKYLEPSLSRFRNASARSWANEPARPSNVGSGSSGDCEDGCFTDASNAGEEEWTCRSLGNSF